MNEIEMYIVERLHSLEDEVDMQKEEISALKEELEKVEKMKALMRQYFSLEKYASGNIYIDHSYDTEAIPEIAEFIGLEMDGDEDV